MSIRLIGFVLGFVTATAGIAQAQDYSAGKTPAQLFASDCSGCHKSPQGLAKDTDARSLASFLREHYTTKKESAGALAAFVAAAGGGAQAGVKPAGRGRTAAPAAEPKPAEEPSPAARPSAEIPRIFPWSARPSDAKPEAEAPAADAAKPTGRRRAAAPPEDKPDADKPAAEGTKADGGKPANRRRTAVPSQAKEEPSTPAIIRHQGGSRPAVRRPAAEPAKPVENAKPADTAKPPETPKPAEVKSAEPPAATAVAPAVVPEEKVKSYLESGAPETARKPEDASATQLNSYATSGDTVGDKAASSVKPAADKPATDMPAEEPKPAAAEPTSKPAE